VKKLFIVRSVLLDSLQTVIIIVNVFPGNQSCNDLSGPSLLSDLGPK